MTKCVGNGSAKYRYCSVSTSCRGKEAILLIDSVVGRGDRFSRFCEKLVDELCQWAIP